MLLIITYHHVGHEDAWPLGGIYPVSPERIREQVNQLGQVFDFIGQNDLVAALHGERDLPERACLITFDDGLAQQYDLALPVLDSLGAPAVFFVCGQPLREGKVLDVHKLQWCLANMAAGDLLEVLERYCQSRLKTRLGDLLAEAPKGAYPRDDQGLRAIKYNFNYHFRPALRQELLAAVFDSLVEDEVAFAESLYMNRQAISRLAERGYLGLHTYAHGPLAGRRDDDIITDLHLNRLTLEDAAGIALGEVGMSYPYGGAVALSPEATNAAARGGVSFGLTTQRGFNFDLNNPMAMFRMDTNDAPGGKAPVFSQHALPTRWD